MNRLPHYFTASNEAIDHQFNGVLKAALVQRIGVLIGKKESNVIQEALPTLSDVIKTHTGVSLKLELVEGMGMFVELPSLSANNPIVNAWRRGPWMTKQGEALVKEANKPIEGSIDLNKGKVDGVFSETTQTLYIGKEYFYHPLVTFTPEEIAAVILHEVGHVFTYFEMLSRTATTNYILRGTLEQLMEAKDRKSKITILKDTEKTSGIPLGDLDDIADIADIKAVSVMLFKQIDDAQRSELGFSAYDTTGAESLADQFAARHGLALPLATGLDKVTRMYGDAAHRSTLTFAAIKVAIWSSLFTAAVFTPIAAGIVVGVITIKLLSGILGVAEYDELPDRYKRLRHQLVDGLKRKEITGEQEKQLISEINQLDKMVESVNEHVSLSLLVLNHLIPSKRKAAKSKVFQQDLESMLANDLFVKSAELKHATA